MELPWWLSVSTLMKRLCKSLLKKRLGDLILGDLDLDQLDVQLTKGTLLLSDLALNADYINRKLSGSAFMVQEGSIKSLLVKFPLPLKSCEIVVEELELVLAPSVASEIPPADTECSVSGSNNQQQEVPKTPRNEVDSNRCSTSMSRDVDEGVRRIANAVKLFLTSFNIKLKDVYVVFDPRTISDDKISEFNRSLVFRIKETEFGTHLSTDGLIKLNNFIKFQEAVIEFLKMDDVDALLQSDVERGPTEISSGHSTTAVLTGPIGGFSGTLNLSIPWCNGSLSLEKIDADVSVDSLQLRVQTSSIQWIVYVWDSLQNMTAAEQNHVHNTADMFMNTSKSVTYSSASSVSKSAPDSALISSENLSWSVFSCSRQDTFQDSFLTRAHVIQDWVPELVGQEDQGGPDSDCDESIDQFFECFEELRNSQMNLGNSGIWDWTCSVFNAITFASTLASGSDRVPIEAPTEKTLRASVAEICVVLSFSNEMDTGNSNVSVCLQDDLRDPEMFSSCLSSVHFEPSKIAQATISSLNMHHLEAKCQNFHLDLETYHQNIRFKASIGKVKLDEYYSTGSHDSEHASLDSPFLDKYLCGEVQAALPEFPFAPLDHREETTGHYGGNSNELIKVELLQTFDDCAFHYDASSTDQDGKSMSITSLSIHLPPFIFWVHFHTIYMVLNFIRKIEFSTKRTSMEEVQSNVWHGRCKASMPGDNESSKSTSRTTDSPSGSLQVQIALSPARIIFCFPSESPSDLSHPAILDEFIIIDHTSSFNLREASSRLLKERSTEVYLGMPSTSMHLAMGNLDIYLVKRANKIMSNGRFSKLSRQNFSSLKIISVSRSSDHDPCIKMIWRKCPATGPEMVKKAWSLSTLHNQKITKKENGKGAGVSSSTTSQDLEESSSSIRQELLQSTQFLLHIQLSCVSVCVSKKDCGLLNQLLDHVFYGLSDGAVSIRKNAMEDELILINDIAVQTSVVFECSTLDVCTELDEIVEVGPLLQTELEGFWNCLKLSIENFTLLSFSNIGGVNHASFLWANHGQGELWGTISNTNEKPCEVSKDFLLVVCKDSTSRRGDGEGTNVLSFGTAGCSVTHIRNPELCESSTSINVHSGTIVAPGGRFDWINAIGLLVSSGLQGSEQADNGTTNDSQAGESSSSSFFLELVDVAVSYEPHFKNSAVNAEVPDLGPKSVACLLAASSFQLSNSSVSGFAATDFNIQLRDLGFLICESTGSKNVTCGYNVDYLHQTGYAKVAKNTFIEAVLRTNSSFWKLEILESQFDVGTCHDTTYGLVRLSSQLQQLYAPDMRDALVHLQSRWNSVQQASKQHIAADASDMSGSSNENLAFSEDSKSDGLLDDIIENAFYIDEDYRTCNFWDSNSHHSLGNFEMDDGFEMKMATPEDSVVNVTHTSPGSSLVTPEANVTQRPLRQNSCPQQIIDSYYVPEPLSSSSSTLSNEDSHCKAGDEAYKIVDREDSGWYNDVSLTIVENHVFKKNIPQGEERLQQEGKSTVGCLVPDGSYNLKGKILIHNMDVKWRMYAGDDWSILRKDATKSLSSNGRDCSSSLEFIVSGLNIQFDMYPDGDISVSKLSLSARGLNLCDQRRDAPWKMVLGSYNSKGYRRESCANALSLELESVRPEPQAPLEDYRLCLEILPLQLHLDQGQLNFLISFFQNDTCNDNPCLSRENEIAGVESTSNGSQAIVEEALLPFFQKFDVKPLVLRINYIPRQFDPIALGKGNYAELLNIVPWKGIDLKLKHVSAMGVYGWNSICETVAGEWLEDISKNQVHKLLKGLRPIRSLVAVGSGTKKLVSLPIKSYKKDGKLLKGIQRGAVAFVRSVSIEAVGLGVHLAAGAHDILLKTECALTAVPPPLAACEVKRTKDNIRANQPESAQQGIKQAYESLTDGLGKTASALIGTPLKVYNRGAGAGSALATAICAVPAAAVAPVSASARAVHYALLGLRNSLDPDQKRESMDKYIGPSQL